MTRAVWPQALAAIIVCVAAIGFSNAALSALVDTITVPAGTFIQGSDRAERELAYLADEAAYGHRVTREQRWYENESSPANISLESFAIMRTPVSNGDYARFVEATGHRTPGVDEATWNSYGLVHPWSRAQRHIWHDGEPAPDRLSHPVVMVSHADVIAYAQWLSRETQQTWRLPTEQEWEKAARGVDGRHYPWGNRFDPEKLNSHDGGPFDTVSVGQYPEGASPFGMLDAAGQVFEWTSTGAGAERFVVKGGSWDDSGCGTCRPAARHSRPADIKHILIGFRLVRDAS